MNHPLEISFRNCDRSEAVEDVVRQRAETLARQHERLMKCRVVIEQIGKQHRKGRLFRARVDLDLPGKVISVGRASKANPGHTDVNLAIRHAFDAAGRRLQDKVRRRRGDVKTHDVPPHGRVVRLFPGEGYGFVRMPDGQEVYFHKNAVVGADFGKLEIGAEVRISVYEEESAKGPQAGTVRPVGRHHIVAHQPEKL